MRRCGGLRRLLLVPGGSSAPFSIQTPASVFFCCSVFFLFSHFCLFFVLSSLFLLFSSSLLCFFSLFVSIFNYLIPSPKIFPPLCSSQNVPPSLSIVRPPKNSSFVPPDFSPPLLGLLSGVFIEHGKWELPYLCPIMETG